MLQGHSTLQHHYQQQQVADEAAILQHHQRQQRADEVATVEATTTIVEVAIVKVWVLLDDALDDDPNVLQKPLLQW